MHGGIHFEYQSKDVRVQHVTITSWDSCRHAYTICSEFRIRHRELF